MSRHPSSIRWSDPTLLGRAARFAAGQGLSTSAAIQRLVDEALRMREHPGIVFQDGPTGRRAALVRGSDVWEVVRSLRHAATDSNLAGAARVELVAENAGLTRAQVETAISYYTAYPTEVDAEVEAAERAEEEAYAAWERRKELLR